jgi:hypothetical protein
VALSVILARSSLKPASAAVRRFSGDMKSFNQNPPATAIMAQTPHPFQVIGFSPFS